MKRHTKKTLTTPRETQKCCEYRPRLVCGESLLLSVFWSGLGLRRSSPVHEKCRNALSTGCILFVVRVFWSGLGLSRSFPVHEKRRNAVSTGCIFFVVRIFCLHAIGTSPRELFCAQEMQKCCEYKPRLSGDCIVCLLPPLRREGASASAGAIPRARNAEML
jgi:hypothetical protein